MKVNLNLRLLILAFLCSFNSYGQSVPFPANPNPNIISPWGYDQVGTNWDTSPYLPFKYNNIGFRLMPPNGVTYDSQSDTWDFSSGEKYPIILFFHGRGETGLDNNNQLKHGGRVHRDAVISGEFPGFLLFPQDADPNGMRSILMQMIDDGFPIDLSRIYVHGLSRGAVWSWDFLMTNPNLVAAAWPMSGVVNRDYTDILYTPLRLAQGGLDRNPTPGAAEDEVYDIQSIGGHIELFLLPNAGHGTWNSMYSRSDFFTWFLEQSVNKIFARYDYYEVCPEDDIIVTLGVKPGNEAYEWRKDGVLIDGADSHELNVNSFGEYTVRVQVLGQWTDWSDPKMVTERQPTQTPPIEMTTLSSQVIPDPNGNTSIDLTLPNGYEQYEWFKNGSSISATQTISADAGTYTALVQEEFGCSSEFSEPFVIINNTMVDVPMVPSGLVVTPISKTEMQLAWSDNATNETGIEVYRRPNISSAYSLIAVLDANEESMIQQDLIPGTEYFYSLRAINSNGASELSSEISAITLRDENLPTVPMNLSVLATTDNSVTLQWDESVDDVGLERYEVYQNGVKILTTKEEIITVYNLIEGAVYRFTVKAKDLAGNLSPASNRVVVSPVSSGLNFEYFEGSWSVLPDFNTLTPVSTGNSENVDISVRQQNDNFAFIWRGKINIPVAGNYTFETYSDDGSKLYIGDYNESNLVVNNDGLHGSQYRSGTYNFPNAGAYPIVITFFERSGGENMKIYWSNTAHGIGSRQQIPSNVFGDEVSIPEETVETPATFTATGLSSNEIQLTWSDVSNEINYQLFRANANFVYEPIAMLGANTTSFVDSGLEPENQYFYQIVALGNYSQSASILSVSSRFQLTLDNSLDDASENGVASNTYSVVSFDSERKMHGTHSASFATSGSYINIDNGNQFIHDQFSERSVAFWIYNEDNTGIQDVFDEGGSTNGYGIRINNGNIELGVQDNHDIETISAPIPENEWAHIATVFNNGTIELYVNGVLLASNSSVGFSSVRSHGDGAGLGSTNGSNAFDEVNNNFGGWIDDFFMFEEGLTEQGVSALIERVFDSSKSSAFTLALPQPTDPLTNVTTEVLSPSSVKISWDPNNVAGYQVLRSANTDDQFQMIAYIGNTLNSHIDSTLVAHTDYYYTVRSRTIYGYSPNSDTLLVAIPNNAPVMDTELEDLNVYYADGASIEIAISDLDGDLVSFSSENLPPFAILNDNGDNTAVLSITPADSDFGNYQNIKVMADDGFGGLVESSFDLTVLANFAPEVSSVDPINLMGGQEISIQLEAIDPNGDGLQWDLTNLPNFISSQTSGDGQFLNLTISPSLSNDGGVHLIELIVQDDNALVPLSTTVVVELTVVPFDPNHKIYVNFGYSSDAPSPWNNFMFSWPGSGASLSNLVNDQGFELDVEVSLESSWSGIGISGGMPNGAYIDEARQSYFYSDQTPETIRVSGLSQDAVYNFEFLASRNKSGDRTTIFEINGETVQVQAAYNEDELVSINGVSPDENGEVLILVRNAVYAGGSYSVAYLNAMVIEAVSTEGVAPLPPSDLTGEFNGNQVDLTWVDNSHNELSFEVYKSIGDNTNYSLIASPVTNQFSDVNIVQQDQFYRVKAVNAFGESSFTNELELVYVNRAPVVEGVVDVEIAAATTFDFDIQISDPEGNDFSYEFSDLPDFMNIDDLGNTLAISLSPSVYDIGDYLVTLEAQDELGNLESKSFNIQVVDVKIDQVVLINVGAITNLLAAEPWNNFLLAPNAGASMYDLLTDEGEVTDIDITLIDGWAGGNSNGAVTGDDSGVYPDVVMNNYFADNSSSENDIQLSGLDPSRVYQLTFFGSRASINDTRISRYSAGGKSAELNVTNNSSETVTIDALSPDSSGDLFFSVNLASGAPYKYLNAIVLKSYSEPLFPQAPSSLNAKALSRNEIELNWQDGSTNEDGFEIYSADSENGPWTLLDTTDPDVTYYLHDGLSSDEVKYYYVRAYNNNSPSLNSNVVSSATLAYSVFLNIGDENFLAPSPWNNTASAPFVGNVTTNLKNDMGNNTGIEMEIISNSRGTSFDAAGSIGMNTGDNSGVYPDIVMQSYYWFVQGDLVSLRFNNLPLNQQFDFEFFASREATQRGTAFTIGDTTVYLDGSFNTSETVSINNVVANEDGEVYVDLSSFLASNAYFNAVVIKASTAYGSNVSARNRVSSEDFMSVSMLDLYPNPFNQSLKLRYSSSAHESLSYEVYDQIGRLMRKESLEMVQGENVIELNLSELKSGFYIMKFQTQSGFLSTQSIIKN